MSFHAQLNCKQTSLCSESYRNSCDPRKVIKDAKLPLAVSDPETQAAGSANCANLKIYQGDALRERVKKIFESLPDSRADLGGAYHISYRSREASLWLKRGHCISESPLLSAEQTRTHKPTVLQAFWCRHS